MHYAEYKQHDPALVREVILTYPFSTIIVNGDEGPVTAQAPLTFREGQQPAGAIEFHLALANESTRSLTPGTSVTVLIQGPGAAISPSWFKASFPEKNSNRSRTAPTYNYVSLVLRGHLEHMEDPALQTQIKDLVLAHEPSDGWRVEELAPDLWETWRSLIQGYRMEITKFDLIAKLSHGDVLEDKPGVIAGLRTRALQDDHAIAALLAGYDGTPASLRAQLKSMRSS
jgi:transcriptional regulator